MAIKTRLVGLAVAALSLAMTASAQLTPAEEGRRVYLANNCYGCHGGRGGGTSFGAPVLRTGEAEVGDLTEVIREGGDRGMPAFPNLNNTTDINNLAAYFRSMRTPAEPIFNNWWEAVPTASIPRPLRLYLAAREKLLRAPVE